MNDPEKNNETRSTPEGSTEALPFLRPPPRAIRSLRRVTRAIERAYTRALVFERLAQAAADFFRGTESQPPRYHIQVPGCGPYPAEVDDVVEIEMELYRLASNERMKIEKLLVAGVQVEPEDVDLDAVPSVPTRPVPANERVVQNPGRSKAAEIAFGK